MTAISAAIVGVPDQILSPYCIDGFVPGIRRALPAIEQGFGGETEWELYADLGAEKRIKTTHEVWGKAFTDSQGKLFK